MPTITKNTSHSAPSASKPTDNRNTATNQNTINVKVVVGDTKKTVYKKKPATPSDAPPQPTVVQNYIQPSGLQPPAQTQTNSYPEPTLPRTGASMFNRPYDVADAAVGMENEAVPEGLASNYDAYQANRQRYFMSLQEQMEELMQSDSNDMTLTPPNAADMPEHGAQENSMIPMPNTVPDSIEYPDDDPETLPVQHRSRAFATPIVLPPSPSPSPSASTSISPSISPFAQPRHRRKKVTPTAAAMEEARAVRESVTEGISAISGGMVSQRNMRAAMLADSVIRGDQNATKPKRAAYERWINTGRHAADKPSFVNER